MSEDERPGFDFPVDDDWSDAPYEQWVQRHYKVTFHLGANRGQKFVLEVVTRFGPLKAVAIATQAHLAKFPALRDFPFGVDCEDLGVPMSYEGLLGDHHES